MLLVDGENVVDGAETPVVVEGTVDTTDVTETTDRAREDDMLPPELLRAAVAGDPRATAQLLSRIQPQVQRFCRARLGRRETTMGSADDVAQDVCMAVLAVLPDYRFAGVSFRAFVFGIARHKIADAFRAIARNRCDAVEELPERTSAEQGPEQLVLEAERNERLGDLLGVLGSRQVEILTLRIAVGLTAEETAEAIGSTPGAVRVAQHRALQRLRRELADRAVRREVVAEVPAVPSAPAAPVRLSVRRARPARAARRLAPMPHIAVAPMIPAQRVDEPVAVAV
ncbi:RNA polymerase sigma factor (sigma-70 family) [Pseudonocardia endophytica]|uniref:RNA polymerase sigma factor (Sigma-70 family) n=1 Tax=Pseudonocardia endophytica TaxID=401976 RepID=A0A4R1HNF4_PSEEN|nr:RNA polymerase sigma factor (sigma-70 family) [Pseudonocardia endophytica]